MSLKTRIFVINNIKLPLNASFKEAFSVAGAKFRRAGLKFSESDLYIYKKSIDARKKNDIVFVYSVALMSDDLKIDAERLLAHGIAVQENASEFNVEYGTQRVSQPPLVVGAGPAGLFAALILAEHGYRPTVIERGGSIKERLSCVSEFKKSRVLDPNSNIQFGAGGAGTFSDGKLVTRVNDPLMRYVLDTFVSFGAPEEILYQAKPHVGTDVLSRVIDKMIQRIEELGGRVLYHTRYITTKNAASGSVAVTNKEEIPYSSLILAVGHSARDTYETLIEEGYDIEAKPFSVGMRIEHLANDIDRAMYGDFAGHPALKHAEYNLSANTKTRGVYTFCMCPGGEVVCASSESSGLVVNGMSYNARDGRNSNSAVVCSVFREDYGATPRKAIEFQREIERRAFLAGGGRYSAPICTVGDFLSESYRTEPGVVLPTFADSYDVRIADPGSYLPNFVTENIRSALLDFDKRISGFACTHAVLTGAETRTSAPIRILRDNETRIARGHSNVYPTGEGAGYAGGITSAAIDGIKTALAVIKRARPEYGG